MSGLRVSLLFSLLDRYLGQALAIATMAIMARLLTPAETGLYLVAQAVILLAENLRDFGVGTYIVQERNLGRTELRSAFTVSLLLSLCMGGAIFAGSGWIAAWYGEPDLMPLFAVATLGFLVLPFGSPLTALMRREMAFRTIAAINVAAAVANFVVTVGFGLGGYGAMSFVWGYVASSGMIVALSIHLRPEPGIFWPSFAGARRVAAFGMISVLTTFANMAYELLPRLVLGRMLGFGAVGLYVRATSVVQLPDRMVVQGLQPVVLSTMANLARSGSHLRQVYLRGYAMMSAIQWPMLLMLVLLADPVVQVLLGPQWHEVPSLVRIMAIATMTLAPAFMTYPVLVAVGRLQDTLYASLISLPPSFLIVLLAASHGIEAVAWSTLVTAPMQMLIALIFVRRAIHLTWISLAKASTASLLISASTLAIPLIIILSSPTGLDLDGLRTAGAILGGALGWAAGLFLTGHPLRAEALNLWRHAQAKRWIGKPAALDRIG